MENSFFVENNFILSVLFINANEIKPYTSAIGFETFFKEKNSLIHEPTIGNCRT